MRRGIGHDGLNEKVGVLRQANTIRRSDHAQQCQPVTRAGGWKKTLFRCKNTVRARSEKWKNRPSVPALAGLGLATNKENDG
jgi:hypothetical protein